jgi:hypothetical protein
VELHGLDQISPFFIRRPKNFFWVETKAQKNERRIHRTLISHPPLWRFLLVLLRSQQTAEVQPMTQYQWLTFVTSLTESEKKVVDQMKGDRAMIMATVKLMPEGLVVHKGFGRFRFT